MNDFEWMKTTNRTTPATTLSTREDEVFYRARLLARLGFSKKAAEQRLKAKVAWEYEGLGKARVLKRVGGLVTEAYRREGLIKRK